MTQYDVIIIGAGAAGLNAALYLARALRTVAIIDNNAHRSKPSYKAHGYIGMDGISHLEFRKKAREELDVYFSTTHIQDQVYEIKPIEGGFEVISRNETYTAKKILISAGVYETYPVSYDMIAPYYGNSFYSCPYCNGYEVRGMPLIIVGNQEETLEPIIMLASNYSDEITVAGNGHVFNDTFKQKLASHNIKVNESKITSFNGANNLLHHVIFEDGSLIKVTSGFVVPEYHRHAEFIDALPLEYEASTIVTDGEGRTSIQGLYVAGEYRISDAQSLTIAAAEGVVCAKSINQDLILTQETR